MKTSVHEIWRRITKIYGERSRTTRHSRALESEVTRQRAENDHQRAAIASQQNEIARLRAENRALLNSILGIAGIPPIMPEGLPGRRQTGPPSPRLGELGGSVEPGISDTTLPSSVLFPTKCHSESAAADDESRSTPPHPSSTAAEKNSPGPQRPRNDIPPFAANPVEGRDFSPAVNDKREAPSSLPKAVQEGLPGRRLVEPGRSDGERPQRQGFSPRQPPRRALAAPLRRRSWHQIMRTLEFESGKKPAASD